MDPCSSLYSLTDGSVVEVSAVMEKVLALNTDEYMFEVIFSVGFMWEEDRSMLLPKATAAEMEACPDNFKCGSCFFDLSQPHDACYPRMDSGWTNTRAPDEWAAGKLGELMINPFSRSATGVSHVLRVLRGGVWGRRRTIGVAGATHADGTYGSKSSSSLFLL